MTYRIMCQEAAKKLAEAGIENEKTDSWLLMEYCCGIDRNYYYLHENENMPESDRRKYLDFVEARSSHIPLQYLTGIQEFMGLIFRVNKNVLIPRQDTEILVEQALKVTMDYRKTLDLCTGSGCIAVSLKHFKPLAEISASDISVSALSVAKENSRMNDAPVDFIYSDLFENIHETFDTIVSNPPYIPTGVLPDLMPEVRDFEPMRALDGAEDGLYFYRKIIMDASDYLNPGGHLLFEIGDEQGDDVSALLKNAGYGEIEVIQDLANRDRVVKGKRL